MSSCIHLWDIWFRTWKSLEKRDLIHRGKTNGPLCRGRDDGKSLLCTCLSFFPPQPPSGRPILHTPHRPPLPPRRVPQSSLCTTRAPPSSVLRPRGLQLPTCPARPGPALCFLGPVVQVRRRAWVCVAGHAGSCSPARGSRPGAAGRAGAVWESACLGRSTQRLQSPQSPARTRGPACVSGRTCERSPRVEFMTN